MEPSTPSVQSENTPNVTNSQSHASNLTRFASYLVDSLILGLLTAVISVLAGANSAQTIVYLISIAYFGYFLSTTGQTLGMKFLGIKVVKEDGSLLNFGLAAVRHFVFGLVSFFTLGIGILWALWDPKKQTLYDKIFHTQYIPENENTSRAKWVIGLNCCGCLLIPVIIAALISLGVATGAMLNNIPGAANVIPSNSMKNNKATPIEEKPVFESKMETPAPTTYETPAVNSKTYSFVKMETATESFKAGVKACSDAATKNPALSKYDVTEYCKCAMDQTLNLKMDLESSVKYCAYYLPEEVQNLIK